MTRRRSNNEGGIWPIREKGATRGESGAKVVGYRYALSFYDEQGKRRQRGGRAKNRTEAQQKLDELRAAVGKGLPVPNGRTTVGAWLDDWLEHTIKPTRAHSTWKSYASKVRLHLKPAIGTVPLKDLAPHHVRQLVNNLRAATDEDGDRRYSDRQVQYVHAVLRSALSTAEEFGHVGRNVAKVVGVGHVEQPNIQPFLPDEAERLLKAAAVDRDLTRDEYHRPDRSLGWARLAPPWHPLFTVLVGMGLRPGEALALRWADVHLDAEPRPKLVVAHNLRRDDGEYVFGPTKTKNNRTLVVPQFVVDALRTHRRYQAEERLAFGAAWEDHDLVFCTAMGTPLEHRNVIRAFDRIMDDAGLDPSHRLYDLRHSAATFLGNKGIRLKVIQEILGHSTYRLTADTYSHLLPPDHEDAADAMDATFPSSQAAEG